MAKIKPAGKSKASKGPKNPGAIGCLILVVLALVLVSTLLYFSIARA